jgi:anti-sigma regulatory factor (Ser/Thr protein kinase)
LFWSEGSHLHFERDLRGDPLPVIAALHRMVTKLGYQDITLDFRLVGFVSPSFVLPIATTCRSYRLQKIDFDILLPNERKIEKLFINTNWAHLVSPEHFEDKSGLNKNHISATQFWTAEDHFRVVDESMRMMLEAIPGIDRSRLKALEWALNEITDNVLNHSASPIGGIVQVVTFPNRHRVEFYVCDAGETIPKTLRNGRPDIGDDTTAMRKAIEEGVTKNSETNQGNGLYGTFKCCEVSGGEFDAISGWISLHHKPGQIRVRRETSPYNGTFIRAAINYDYEKLLEKALVFKGRSHDPGYDYVERIYQSNSDAIHFKVAEELNAFGTRESGRLARTKISNLMDNSTTPIELDFENVRIISSSFADEVFGKLFVDLGPLAFGRLCQFRNVDQTVRGLIDRAIEQRMKV